MEGVSHEARRLAGHRGLGRLVVVYDDNHITIDGATELRLRRRRRRPLRGLRLARRAPRRGRRRPRRPRGRRCAGPPRSRTGRRCSSCAATSPTRRPRRPTTTRPTATPLVRRRDPRDQGGHGPPARRDVLRARRRRSTLYRDGRRPRRRAPARRGTQRLGALGGDRARRWDACLAARGLDGWDDEAARRGRPARRSPPARRQRRVPAGRRRRRARPASAAAPTSPATPAPQLKGHGVQSRRRARRAPDLLRRPRARHGRGHERHGPARRRAARRRHVLRLQRLHAARRCASPRCREAQGHLLASPTTRSASARTAPPTSRSSTSPSLRAIPGLRVIRPADANETAAAWRVAVGGEGPTALILSRQDVPVRHDARAGRRPAAGRLRAREPTASTATRRARPRARRHRQRGRVCVDAAAAARGRRARGRGSCRCRAGTCSSCSTTTTRTTCSRPTCRRWPSRPASPFGWDRWADDVVGIDRFGASAPGDRSCSTKLGFTAGATWPSGPAQLLDDLDELDEEDPMGRLHELLRRARPEPVARQPQAGLDHRPASSQRWVDRGVRGLTSNPTIFQKAIADSARLRRAVRRARRAAARRVEDALLGAGRRPTSRTRSRILRPVLRRERRRRRLRVGRGGARASPATPPAPSAAARHLHEPIDEPNLYVKIPGTAEGVAADPGDDRRGAQHQRHPALRPRPLRRGDRGVPRGPRGARADGGDLSPVSSAWPSFFVSRVDTEVDRRLDEIGTPRRSRCEGKAAVANAQLAYQLFLERFSGPALGRAGRRGRPGAAAAVGVDVDQEPGATPTRSTSTRSSVPTPSTRCPRPRSTRSTTTARSPAPSTPTPTPTGPSLDRARRRSASTSTTSAATLEDEGVASFAKAFDELLDALVGQGRPSSAPAGLASRRCTASWSSSTTSPASSPSGSIEALPRPPQRRVLASRCPAARPPARCYERLADDAGTQIDWWKVDVYWGDERCVPARRRRLELPPRPRGAARAGRRGQRQLPDALRGGRRPLPAAPRRARPARRRPPRPRRRRPHRVAVPGLAGARRRPRPPRRDERGPDRHATPTRA